MLVAIAAASPAQAQAPPTNEDLHAALHLRPDQEAAWHAYDQATTPTAGDAEAERQLSVRLRSSRTPDRLDLMVARLGEQRAALARQAVAIKGLYSVLTSDQQARFDAITLPPNEPR